VVLAVGELHMGDLLGGSQRSEGEEKQGQGGRYTEAKTGDHGRIALRGEEGVGGG
jgi:hypothetical protein